MQNVDQTGNEDANNDNQIKTVEIDQENPTSAMTVPSVTENPQVPTSQSTFGLDVSCSDDDEVSEVDSFILDADDPDPGIEPNFLLSQSVEASNLQTVTVDPETHARLEALLDAAGIGKLSTADGKALTDPEVLRKLTSSVSCALDEAAQALHRMRAEQQSQLGNTDSQRSLAEACSDGDVPTVRKLLREGGSVHETTEEGDSLLSLACSAGYYELAQVLLAMKANVEDRGIKGDCTPLMEAASGGYVDIVKLLIAHGADVNAQSSAGNTPLHYAACGGYEDVVQVLIDVGANVEQHNENGHTPLMEAASAGHVGVARILLNSGAGINTHSNEFKESALTLACYKGHLEMVKFLLDAGADQEHKTDEMHTALMEASMDGHVEVARLLLDSGAQVNMPADSFESPLTLAACGGHVELANLLIERGANIEEVNDEGYTPLMEAAREGHEEMVALLLAHDADINAQTEETQETALTLACCGGFLDVADFLISAGADIELGCSTPLMEAAQEGHLELVKYLLKNKANVQATTGTGDTALTYACENGHTDVADVLLQHGAVLEHESEGGRTPLMKAARAGHLCTVQFLINKGADVNRQTTTNDHTVLSLACAGGHFNVVELLLAHGGDPTHKLKDGSTMVIEAAKGGHTQVVKLLLEYPNRMLMNSTQEMPQLTANETAHLESRVPIHGLANIVPPSEPDANPAKSNNLTTMVCDHSEGSGCKKKALDKDMNIPIKAWGDQVAQNMNIQKALVKKAPSTGTVHNIEPANKTSKTSNLTTTNELSPQLNENGVISDLLPDDTIDLKAGERLEAIISNVMAKELISTPSTREEQILRKQQILEELQKVERELQEKAQQQLLITAQHQQQQHQKHQQLQQALQNSRQPLHQIIMKQLEEQKKMLSISSQSVPSATELPDVPLSNNLDKQVEKPAQGEIIVTKPSLKPNISESNVIVSNGGGQSSEPTDGNLTEKPTEDSSPQEETVPNGNTNEACVKTNGGQQSVNGGSQSHNGGSQSSQMSKPPPPPPSVPQPAQGIPLPQTTVALSQAPPKPPQLLPNQQQQLEQQLHQLQLQQQQQQSVMNPQPFVLNESQRQALHNLIVRQQQEAQQLAQQTTLQFPQLQLTPTQQELFLQVISQQQFTQQQIQQAQHAVQQQQQAQQQHQQQQQQFISPSPQPSPQHPNLLQHPAAINPSFSQALFNQQQQQQLLQQQQFLQQQLQQIKPPVMIGQTQGQNPVAPRKMKKLLPLSEINPDRKLLEIETVTPPPSTPLTPNPSPASDSMSALIDLDAQTESNHDTALTLACAGGHAELVTYLLTKGADIEHRDKKGFTPLILAATAGHVDVVEILLENTAEIEAQSERTKDTPLSLACSGGRYEVVELLLSRTANKEHRNVSDYTPLSLAASGGFVNIIKLLLSHGAEINSRTGSKLGISPLMLAAMNGHTAAVKLLLDMGSDINAQIETNRNTALTLACFQGRHEVVSLLVDRRAIIEHRAKTGLTPLMEAASGGYVEVGRVLLDKGADVNAPPVPSSRDTALTIAADKGHYRFVELLLSRHAAVDVKNKKGNSPLWLACHGGHLDVVQLLVTAGADIDSQDNRKVSCLMAAFRKGHIKVVKWMVKHVNQFPSDAELSRYISTVTDKELQKKCQQCMEIIVSAKDRQAAEANKVATSLLEELDKEKQHEENKRLAAAKKRERKKKKKKEKQGTKDKEQSDNNSKNSSPEPESEDSQVQEPLKEEKKPDLMVIQPPTATTTSTLGLTLPTSEPIYTKAKGRSKKPEKKLTEVEMNGPTLQDENQDPLNNKVDRQSTNTSKVESRKNKKNQREREKITPDLEAVVDPSNISTSVSNRGSNNKAKSISSNKRKKDKNSQINCSTAIGDLDDFGNLPMISDRDIEKLSKKVEKTKGGNLDKLHLDKGPSEPSNPNMLSVKSTTAVANSPKRGQKKEDGWKEVIRKSKKVQVPASAISRVIGRGGCNINAIREVSGANIEVEKNKGSGERTITIKGSAEVTRQAHALITALVTDPDRELVEILPKTKNKQPVENKSLYFIPPNDTPPINNANHQSNNSQQKTNKALAPRLQQQQQQQQLQQQQQSGLSGSSNRSSGSNQNAQNTGMVWGNSPAPGAISPRRNTAKSAPGAPYIVSSSTMNGPLIGDKSGVTRQLFMGERRGFGSPNPATTVVVGSLSTVTKTSPASPSFNIRPDVRLQQPNIRNPNPKTLIPGTVKLLQRPNSVNPRFDGQPLPLVTNQTTTTMTTLMATSSSTPMNMSSSGEFSPFNNLFSNAAEQLLGKKDDSNERMNFAAAAGVIPPFTGSNVMSPVPNSPDPALQAKAPGFKPMTSGPRMANPQDVMAGYKGPGPGYPMMPQFMDMNVMNSMQASLQALQGFQGMYPFQGFNGPQGSPNLSPRSSQLGLSPRTGHLGFDPQAIGQKEEYTMPNQPMTLPKISSSLNPNAPDFTSRSVNSGPGGPQNFPGFQGNPGPPQEMSKHLLAVFNNMGPNPPNSNQPPGGPPTPDGVSANQDPLSGMSNNQLEFFATLMQQVALQNQTPGSPGVVQPPGPGFTPPPMVPRAFSPLPVQGRPNSAPSVGGLIQRDGASPTPIGPPSSNSPLPPSTPPMPEMIRHQLDDRRHLRPIGGERVHKKAPGPPLPSNDVSDFGESFWNLTPQLNMDWNQKAITAVGMSPATLQTSVISTSVNMGSNMSTDLSSSGDLRIDNSSHPRPGMDDLNDQSFPNYTQNSTLASMPLFNGVGGPYPNTGFPNSGIGSGGDSLQSMWSAPLDTQGVDDVQDSGVNAKNKVNEMWNNWNK